LNFIKIQLYQNLLIILGVLAFIRIAAIPVNFAIENVEEKIIEIADDSILGT
jgi:hypothetical protein